jgi:hypothetical protein
MPTTELARTPKVGDRVVVPLTATEDGLPLSRFVDLRLPATGTVVAPEAHRFAWLWRGVEGIAFVDLPDHPAYTDGQALAVTASDLILEA